MDTYMLQGNLKCHFAIFISLIIMTSSCVNTKKLGNVWVYKGQKYYIRAPHGLPPATDTSFKKTLKKGVTAKIKLPDGVTRDRIDIVFLEQMNNKDSNLVSPAAIQVRFQNNGNGTFFPLDTTIAYSPETRGVVSSRKFRYLEIKPIIQALSIPVKLRFKLNDSTKSTASASFNVGIAYGAKFTHNVYKKLYYIDSARQNVLNHNFKRISFSPGVFLGPTVIDLKAANTYNNIKKDRSTPGLTYGAFFVIGYNEFNLGIALGADRVFGTQEKNWMYNGKMWLGFVFAIDLVK